MGQRRQLDKIQHIDAGIANGLAKYRPCIGPDKLLHLRKRQERINKGHLNA